MALDISNFGKFLEGIDQLPSTKLKEVREMGGLVMSARELAEEIRRFYSVQEYADDALAEVIAKSWGLGPEFKVVISVERSDAE